MEHSKHYQDADRNRPIERRTTPTPATNAVSILRTALSHALRQNESDMLLTGDECRAGRAALAATDPAAIQPAIGYEVFFNGRWMPASEEAYWCTSEKNRRTAPVPAMPAAPSEAVSVRDAIFKALRGYHMTNMNFSDDEGGGSYTLVDLMTPDCKSIGEGEAEMQILADEIDAAISALQGKPEAQAGETGGAA